METDEYKALRLKFEGLCDENERLYNPKFETVFKCLSGLDGGIWVRFLTEPTNFANELPDINLDQINEALSEAGFANDKQFCCDFIRYNEIFAEGKAIQRDGLYLNLKEVLDQQEPNPESDGWRFYPISFIASPELHSTISEMMANYAKDGKGLFENATTVDEEDETFDEYLNCEEHSIKCSLQPYVRELESYNVIKSLFSSKELSFKYALQTIETITNFIKEHSTEPNKVRNYTAEQIKIFDDVPIWGLFYQILILYGLCYLCQGASNKIGEGKDGYDDVTEFWRWIKQVLKDKLLVFTYMPFGDGDKERLKPLCDYLYSTELGRSVQEAIFDCSNTDSPQELPNELNTDEARKYFARAIQVGYMHITETGVKWTFGEDKGQARLGYFCNKVFKQPRPISALELFFSVKKLSSSITSADIDAKRADVIKWRKDIDDNIFTD